jgi:hypothetical protein
VISRTGVMARTVFETHAQVSSVSSGRAGTARGASSGGGSGSAGQGICRPLRIVNLWSTPASCMAYVLLSK